MKPSTLVIGYGNPSRGVDALAPLLLEALRAHTERGAWSGEDVELLTDFQLQVEHVLYLEGRRRVVFVDAAARGPEPFSFDLIAAAADPAPMTHAMSPATLLAVYRSHFGSAAPESRLLAILSSGSRSESRCIDVPRLHNVQECPRKMNSFRSHLPLCTSPPAQNLMQNTISCPLLSLSALRNR